MCQPYLPPAVQQFGLATRIGLLHVDLDTAAVIECTYVVIKLGIIVNRRII